MLKDVEISETGFITILGMILAFSVACCRNIQTSRCSKINSPCVSCEREVIDEETLVELRQMEEAKSNNNTRTPSNKTTPSE